MEQGKLVYMAAVVLCKDEYTQYMYNKSIYILLLIIGRLVANAQSTISVISGRNTICMQCVCVCVCVHAWMHMHVWERERERYNASILCFGKIRILQLTLKKTQEKTQYFQTIECQSNTKHFDNTGC